MENPQIIYKGTLIRLSFHLSTETAGQKGLGHDIFKVMKEKIYNQESSPQQGSPSGLMEKSKNFADKEFSTTKPALK